MAYNNNVHAYSIHASIIVYYSDWLLLIYIIDKYRYIIILLLLMCVLCNILLLLMSGVMQCVVMCINARYSITMIFLLLLIQWY